jgi:hypothetical protein
MQLDLYQRRGMYGLGAVDPITGIDTSTGLVAPPDPTAGLPPAPSTGILSSLTGGLDLTSMSPTTLLIAGAFGLWLLSSVFSGGKKAYRTVARPLKKHRKKKRALEEAGERYESERKRIERGTSSRRGGGGFF